MDPGGRPRGCCASLLVAGPARRVRQRTSEADLHARRVVENTHTGRYGAEEPSIKAPQDRAVLDQAAQRVSAQRDPPAVAGKLKLEVRRQATLHPRIRPRSWGQAQAGQRQTRRVGAESVTRKVTGPRGSGAGRRTSEARSGIGRHAGCSSRESVAEVGEMHLSRSRGRARGNPQEADAKGWPEASHPPLTRRDRVAASERVRGQRRASEQRTRVCLLGSQDPGRTDGRRPGSLRSLALNKRGLSESWRGVVLRTTSKP